MDGMESGGGERWGGAMEGREWEIDFVCKMKKNSFFLKNYFF